MHETVAYTSIRPQGTLSLLSHLEVAGLMQSSDELHKVFRQCALAVLCSDLPHQDDQLLQQQFPDFAIELSSKSRGFSLKIYNAPRSAFVDGKMIQGMQNQIFSLLRDIVFANYDLADNLACQDDSAVITDTVFKILRHANVVKPGRAPNLVVCWGGHAISREAYDYSKEVGFQMGLRGLDIVTGSGMGAMKGPMKGAAVGHSKQHIEAPRYIGLTEPGIIASEAPNAMVNELVILPDIEKRLEAFVRLGHVLVVFPGGVGTAEEVLYILAILMQQQNQSQCMPLLFVSSEAEKDYFIELDAFLRATLGEDVARFYQILVGNPEHIAQTIKAAMNQVHRFRRRTSEAYEFNWQLHIPQALQQPFIPTHENVRALALKQRENPAQLAIDLRAFFSAVVAGNVKTFGREQVALHGPYQVNAHSELAKPLEQLLNKFIEQKRMAIIEHAYKPCYQLI